MGRLDFSDHELRVRDVEVLPLDIPLLNPLRTAKTTLRSAQTVVVKATLVNGRPIDGWGEAPALCRTAQEQPDSTLTNLQAVAGSFRDRLVPDWLELNQELRSVCPDSPASRSAFEMAIIDAVAAKLELPLYMFFGGRMCHVETDITIPICDETVAGQLAASYAKQGFRTLKAEIGTDPDEDTKRLLAIRTNHPQCDMVLDGHEAFSADEALRLLSTLDRHHLTPALFIQPVPREDWDALARVTRGTSVPVAADESCGSVHDAYRMGKERIADVINIELARHGVWDALQIANVARHCGLGLMIGGAVETRIAMGFSAHFAAGTGGFQWVDLPGPLLLAEDPVQNGYRADGASYDLCPVRAGAGCSLAATPSAAPLA